MEDAVEPDDDRAEARRSEVRRSCGPVKPPRSATTWCHDCEGRGARWAPRSARLQALPAMAAQMQGCDTCDGTGRLPGVQPPV